MTSTETFLRLVKYDCKKHNVKLHLPDTKMIDYFSTGSMVSGYFDSDSEDGVILACAVGKPESSWIPILAHEYSHMQQWLDDISGKNKIWSETAKIEELGNIDEWLSGKDIPDIQKIISSTQALELDCETRTLELIRKLGLNIEVPSYIKAANSYVIFYSVLLKHRKWCDIPPYESQLIIDAVPEQIVTLEQCASLAVQLEPLYLEACWPVVNNK